MIAQGEMILPKDLPKEVLEYVGKQAVSGDAGESSEILTSEEKDLNIQSLPVEEAIIGQPVLDLYDTLYQDLCTTHKSNILEHAEREIIARALEATEGKLVKAADILGITTATLRKRIDRYDL